MIYVCYPKCTTCQKVQKQMSESGVDFEIRHIKEENPSFDELKEWHMKSGLPLKRFFNTSGQIYRSMGLKDKLADMSEEEQLRLLAEDGMLVKRPILLDGDSVSVGGKDILKHLGIDS